jgi:hypothetical protein
MSQLENVGFLYCEKVILKITSLEDLAGKSMSREEFSK